MIREKDFLGPLLFLKHEWEGETNNSQLSGYLLDLVMYKVLIASIEPAIAELTCAVTYAKVILQEDGFGAPYAFTRF